MWNATGELVGRRDELAAIRHALRDRLGTHLIAIEEWDEEKDLALHEECSAEVRSAQKEAERKGTLATTSIDFPHDVRTMFTDVYAEMPWHLKEEQEAMVAELEAKKR